jgi:hypothetical protein
MHIEANLDEIHAARLIELQQRLQKPIPEIVSDILSKALDKEMQVPETVGQRTLRILEERGLLGCMEGDGNLSVDYKKHLWRSS